MIRDHQARDSAAVEDFEDQVVAQARERRRIFPTRRRYPIPQLAAGATWPDVVGGAAGYTPFRWLALDNRGAADVIVAIEGPALNDPSAYELKVPAGTRRVKNLRGPMQQPAREIRIQNIGAVATSLLLELDSEPIVDIGTDSVLTSGGAGVSSANPLPDNLAQVGGVAVVSSAGGLPIADIGSFVTESTTPLAASGTFTGPWHDCLNYNYFGAVAGASTTGTLNLDEAADTTPSVGDQLATTATVVAGPLGTGMTSVYRIVSTRMVLRQGRVRFVNGATAQTAFNCQVALSPMI